MNPDKRIEMINRNSEDFKESSIESFERKTDATEIVESRAFEIDLEAS